MLYIKKNNNRVDLSIGGWRCLRPAVLIKRALVVTNETCHNELELIILRAFDFRISRRALEAVVVILLSSVNSRRIVHMYYHTCEQITTDARLLL